jgi:hypothetical protein
MAIDFRCSQCGRLLRTGDETAGRQAQCPQCGAITPIPGPAGAAEMQVAGLAPLASEASAAPGLTPGNPFGPGGGHGPAWPGQPSAAGPYYVSLYFSPAQRVSGPATALIVIAILGIIAQVVNIAQNVLMLVVGGVMAARQPHVPEPDVPEWIATLFGGGIGLAVGVVGLALAIIILMGAIRMLQLRSYTFAMTAAVLAVIPCTSPCCCLLGMPFGIWALVVLGDSSVKAAFRS